MLKPSALFAIVLVFGMSHGAFSQEPESREPSVGQTGDTDHQDSNADDHASPEMKEMARSMKSMADMCRMMMEREMQFRPVWIAVAAVVGTLLTVALALFVVLEIQWIRHWNHRLKSER